MQDTILVLELLLIQKKYTTSHELPHFFFGNLFASWLFKNGAHAQAHLLSNLVIRYIEGRIAHERFFFYTLNLVVVSAVGGTSEYS